MHCRRNSPVTPQLRYRSALPPTKMVHSGGCHCGNIHVQLQLSKRPEDSPLRACACSFCRSHNTRTVADPDGLFELWADDWSVVESYRFSSRTADFILCRRCGVYIAAVCAGGRKRKLLERSNRLHFGSCRVTIRWRERYDAAVAPRLELDASCRQAVGRVQGRTPCVDSETTAIEGTVTVIGIGHRDRH